MPLTINTNIASLNAQNNLTTSQSALQTSLQRLSSGLRINSAKDDAAGLAITTRMSSQINGLNQASRNANDGISMSQTAEGAMATISTNLQRMRDLSVQAANGSNSTSDRQAIQAEIVQIKGEINRIATQTQFNGSNLLDGSLSNSQYQVGANSNQTISFSIGNSQSTAIGNNIFATSGTNSAYDVSATSMTQATATTANSFVAQTLTITGSNGVATKTSALVTGSTALQVATAVNAITNTTNVAASASTSATLGGFSAAGPISFTLYGDLKADGSSNPVTITANLTNTTDVSAVATAINAQSGTSGISATADNSTGKISLYNKQGSDITVTNKGTPTFTLTGRVSGGTLGAAGVNGLGILDGTASAALAAEASSTVGGQVQFSSSGLFSAVTDAAANGGLFAAGTTTVTNSNLNSVSSIDVTQADGNVPIGANAAITTIDAALLSINNAQALMGAVQNRFTTVISNLNTTAQNLTQSRSRIQDTDFAAETASLTRGQILQQAGTAMLAQANSLPNGVMALLR
jgi:flagellin